MEHARPPSELCSEGGPDFVSLKEEYKKLKEANSKLELELKETRELEKSNRYHLQTSREMIGNLQDTVSHLVYLKRDAKRINDELVSKDMTIASMQKDKENMEQACKESLEQIRKTHDSQIEELTVINDKKLQQIQYDSDTKIAELTCVIEELKDKFKEIEEANRDKMNVVVLEYEEKVQRSAVETSQLQEQLRLLAARSDANIEVYRRKIEDLEEKLKQKRFKEYLAQNNYASQSSQSQVENKVERPYSAQSKHGTMETVKVNSTPVNYMQTVKVNSTPVNYMQTVKVNSVPIRSYPKPNQASSWNKTPTLQVMHRDNKVQNVQKDEKTFSIKKRKLYSDKDYLNQ
ncbi:uncharacterized protein LOC112043760 [Bicyclus anynana]|uniref:Uncharacterized protein LOC112043760 n=1 Tax=Bicyclus anynana TaxID=110368 RepID=A0ABM3LFI1_BICAN|nr:uncharacterized protein LOC112043760 [Bicyclus anynana]